MIVLSLYGRLNEERREILAAFYAARKAYKRMNDVAKAGIITADLGQRQNTDLAIVRTVIDRGLDDLLAFSDRVPERG
jgi:hypothetical protein